MQTFFVGPQAVGEEGRLGGEEGRLGPNSIWGSYWAALNLGGPNKTFVQGMAHGLHAWCCFLAYASLWQTPVQVARVKMEIKAMEVLGEHPNILQLLYYDMDVLYPKRGGGYK